MSDPDTELLPYKRSRFSTRLHRGRRYTAAHVWMWEAAPGEWRVGFTKFALRMLGDPVEFELEVRPGQSIEKGQVVGWIEGFKAVTDVYSPMAGELLGANPGLDDDLELLRKAMYGDGWLFAVRGAPDADALDAEGYVAVLDATIDKMLGQEAVQDDG